MRDIFRSSWLSSVVLCMVVVPVKEGMTISAAIQEQYNGFGDNHFWEALFSQVKPPLEYNGTESEDFNDGMAAGQYVESGDRVLGTIDSNYDRDWYLLELGEGEHDLTIKIDANQFFIAEDAGGKRAESVHDHLGWPTKRHWQRTNAGE